MQREQAAETVGCTGQWYVFLRCSWDWSGCVGGRSPASDSTGSALAHPAAVSWSPKHLKCMTKVFIGVITLPRV